MDNTVLLYQFSPGKISASVGGTNPIASRTDLTVKISKKSAVKPTITSITIDIPTGAGEAAANRLSDAHLPAPDYDRTAMAAWSISVSGSTLTIRPASGNPTQLDHPIDLIFKEIVISPTSGLVPIRVQEVAPNQIQATFPLYKMDSSTPDVTPPSPNAGTQRLKLEYGFNSNPYPIRVSGTGNDISTPDLVVTISRRPELAVTVKNIQITIPLGGNDAFSLSSSGRLPQPRFDQSGPWDIKVTESAIDTVTISPKIGTSGQVTSTIEFTLPGIVINQAIGFVPITIKESTPDETTDGFTYRLEKLEADFPVRRFYATPPVLSDLNQTTTLRWESTGERSDYSYRVRSADGGPDGRYGWIPKECLRSGDCYTSLDGSVGVQTLQLAETTSFALDVIKPDAQGVLVVHKTLVIPVRVEVPYFSSAARLTQMAGQFAVLRWRAFNASRVTVRLNDDVIDRNAPADTYLDGYRVDLERNVPQGHFHLTAHARVGTAAAYYASFPDVNMQKPTPVQQREMGTPDVLAVAANKNVALAVWGGAWRVIDLDAREVPSLGNFETVGEVSAAALTPDGKLAIFGGAPVRAYDVAGRGPVWSLGGQFPRVEDFADGMVMTADGRLLLTTINSDVRVIEMSNPNGPASMIQTGYSDQMGALQSLLTLAVSSDGATAIAGKAGSRGVPLPDYLVVLDVAGRSVKGRVPISGYAVSQVAMSPDGLLALATVYNNGQSAVIFIDVLSQTVTETIPLENLDSPPLGGIVIGDSYAFILKGKRPTSFEPFPDRNTVAVLDIAKKEIVATLDAGTGAKSLAVRPDNSSIVVTNAQGILII